MVREGWTVSGLARVCAIPQPTLHNWLSGRSQLSPELVDQVVICLRIDLAELASRAPDPRPEAPAAVAAVPVRARRGSAWRMRRDPAALALAA